MARPRLLTAMRIALGLEYDGSSFCGWQTQPSHCAVQDAVDTALSQIAAHTVESQCAGRTDAGVHAFGQVVHFDTHSQRPLTAWVRGVNTLLPRAVAVNWALEVPEAFHARYSARGRAYVYLLVNRSERPALHYTHVGWHHHNLNLDFMREAAAHLLGTHDFSAFRSAECQARSPIKELRRLDIQRLGEMVVFDFAADAFLHRRSRTCRTAAGHQERRRNHSAVLYLRVDGERVRVAWRGAGLRRHQAGHAESR